MKPLAFLTLKSSTVSTGMVIWCSIVYSVPIPFHCSTAEGKRMCYKEELHGTFPMVWDWLKDAEYHKFKDPRGNKTFDAWTMHVSYGGLVHSLTNSYYFTSLCRRR